MGYIHRNKREGFWCSETNDKLPKPVPYPESWEGKEDFIKELTELEANHAKEILFKGFSRCRLCSKINGTVTYTAQGWEWPQGYRHYIVDHNVRPSLAFQEMVMGDCLGE